VTDDVRIPSEIDLTFMSRRVSIKVLYASFIEIILKSSWPSLFRVRFLSKLFVTFFKYLSNQGDLERTKQGWIHKF